MSVALVLSLSCLSPTVFKKLFREHWPCLHPRHGSAILSSCTGQQTPLLLSAFQDHTIHRLWVYGSLLGNQYRIENQSNCSHWKDLWPWESQGSHRISPPSPTRIQAQKEVFHISWTCFDHVNYIFSNFSLFKKLYMFMGFYVISDTCVHCLISTGNKHNKFYDENIYDPFLCVCVFLIQENTWYNNVIYNHPEDLLILLKCCFLIPRKFRTLPMMGFRDREGMTWGQVLKRNHLYYNRLENYSQWAEHFC